MSLSSLFARARAATALCASIAPVGAQTDWAAVEAAAKREGKVVLYSAHVGVPYHPEIAKMFTAKYGIEVEILEARASEIRERIRTEHATGRVAGDVSYNGASTTFLMQQQGLLQAHQGVPNRSKLDGSFYQSDYQFPVYIQSYAILVNSKLVPPDRRPKRWTDLLDPKWQGKIISDDLRALGGGGAMFSVTYKNLGRDFHEKLAAQKLHFTRAVRESPRRVARGEFQVAIPFAIPDSLLHQGLPLEVVLPEEGNPYITYDVAVLKGAPHPNAARLFMNFFLTDEAQMVFLRSGRGSPVKGMNAKAPESVRALVNAKLMGTPEFETMEDLLKTAKDIYK